MSIEPFVISPPQDFLKTHLHLLPQAERLAQAYENKELVEEAHLKAVGEVLWQALALKDSLKQAKQAAGLNVLPIVIASNDAAIMQLPWETLYHPELGFLGRETAFSLSRHDPDLKPALPVPKAEPLRILLFSALPDDLGEQERLEIEAEQAKVQEVLLEAELKGEVELHMPDDGRFETFKAELEIFRPQVVYLSGHGVFEHDLPHKRAFGSLLFEDGQGKGILIPESKIAECFTNLPVQLVVLSACLSAKQHPKYPNNGLSNTLYRAGVPHVIGMRESIFDQAVIKFAETFLGKIADKHSVALALQAARQAIVQPLKAGVYREVNSDPQRQALSFGQWCLPQLISHRLDQPLTVWDFTRIPKTRIPTKDLIGQISVPERFLGRRRELSLWQNRLATAQFNSLLITGAGGMGKTALASKLIKSITKEQHKIFVVDATNFKHSKFRVSLLKTLSKEQIEQYREMVEEFETDLEKLEYLLEIALGNHKNQDQKMVLFFDNLESVQYLTSPHALMDENLKLWLDAALSVSTQGLKLIVTSRWQLPDWKGAHCALGRPVYGDYVAFARQQALSLTSERLQTAYRVLGGNFRALTFFAEAAQGMSLQEETNFLAALGKAEAEAQTDMALAKLLSQCSESALQLLLALRAYPVAIPLVGVQKLAYRAGLADSESLLKGLLAVSLVEQYRNANTEKLEYQLAPLVQTYLDQHYPTLTQDLRQTAAKFLLWQLENGLSHSWDYRLATHAALTVAGLELEAQRFVLDYIVGILSLAGLYESLLKEWLPTVCESKDLKTKAEALGQIGKQYVHIGGYAQAFDYLERSLAIQQAIGDKSGEGRTLNNMSQIYAAKGDYETALSYLQGSLAIQQAIGDKSGEGRTLNNMSQIYAAKGDYETALSYLQGSLAIQQAIGDKSGEGRALNNMSTIAYAKGDYETALSYLQGSLAIQQAIGDKSGEGTTLNNMSQIYDAKGDYETALSYLQRSLAIQQAIGDKSGEGTTLNNMSQIYAAKGDYETALSYLQRSLAIQQAIGDKAGEGTTLNNMSQIFKVRGDYETALSYLQRSLAIRQAIGDKSGEGRTLNNMSQIYDAKGDYETALSYLQGSLAIQQAIGDKSGEGTTLNNISQIYDAKGDYETALSYLQRSLAIQQAIGDKAGEGRTLNNMSQIYAAKGDYETALSYLQGSLAIQQAIGDKSGEGTTLSNISQIFKVRGDYETALSYLQRSLAIQQAIGDKAGEGTTLNNMSQIFKVRGDYETALSYLQRSLAIQQAIGDIAGMCATLFNMGHIHYQNEQVQEAVSAWVTVYRMAKKINLAQVLQALDGLAEQLGSDQGLALWEQLVEQLDQGAE